MVQVVFPIEQQIDKMIADYTNLAVMIKRFGDPVGSNELMNTKLHEIKRFSAFRGSDLFKIPRILESFLNEARYDSPSEKVVLQVSDVTADRLYIEASPNNMFMHVLYTLTDDIILPEVIAYGEDKNGVWGGMYLVGTKVISFRPIANIF